MLRNDVKKLLVDSGSDRERTTVKRACMRCEVPAKANQKPTHCSKKKKKKGKKTVMATVRRRRCAADEGRSRELEAFAAAVTRTAAAHGAISASKQHPPSASRADEAVPYSHRLHGYRAPLSHS